MLRLMACQLGPLGVSPALILFAFSLPVLQRGSWYCSFMPLGACSCADKPEAAQPLKYRQKCFQGTTLRPAALAREAHTSSTFIQSNRLKRKCPSGSFPGQRSHCAFRPRFLVSSVHSRSRLFLRPLQFSQTLGQPIVKKQIPPQKAAHSHPSALSSPPSLE